MHNDPKSSFWLRVTDTEIKVMLVALELAGFFFVMWAVHEANVWRVHHFPHAEATITRMWNEEVHPSKGAPYTVTLAEIIFVRTHLGKSYNCDETIEIGRPPVHVLVGDHLDIVPKSGTCYNPLITKDVLG
ncbi:MULTISPECIES: hypothetical protein [Rhizobium]|uniref:Uncharacterized protein n=1 Tax=Rhizobium paranaense TaxID=1650438 RepID=A0A7W9D164_9HYPH|nr:MULTISPECIES: hypothetical protein [Rhizobium]MBB5573992.1 hypothetical protein [Rhizobium paranaense]PST61300.1 hypothetical protein C9E91_17930 [Rhizobium sp. SEMIA4064]